MQPSHLHIPKRCHQRHAVWQPTHQPGYGSPGVSGKQPLPAFWETGGPLSCYFLEKQGRRVGKTKNSIVSRCQPREPKTPENRNESSAGGGLLFNRFVSPSVITHDSAQLKQSKAAARRCASLRVAARHSNPLSRPRSFEDGRGLLVSPTV